MMTDDWRTKAACRGVDPNVFHPTKGDADTVALALSYCGICPVVAECLDYAERFIDVNQIVGIYGNMTGRQRRMRRRARREVGARSTIVTPSRGSVAP